MTLLFYTLIIKETHKININSDQACFAKIKIAKRKRLRSGLARLLLDLLAAVK